MGNICQVFWGESMGVIKITETGIKDLLIIEPAVYGDHRGYFTETYNKSDFMKAGLDYDFVQDNQSKSRKNVLRGLHFQKTHPQAKLVRVLDGEVFDVAVDLRPGSPTFGKWFGITLTAENMKQFLIPRGFAHGFLVQSETAIFAYKCDDYYHPEDEAGIRWNDPDIRIEWPIVGEPVLSDKDKIHPWFREVEF